MQDSNLLRMIFCLILILQITLKAETASSFHLSSFSRSDGWYNNQAHPHWGTPGQPLGRSGPANYEDGIKTPVSSGKPNPYDLTTLMRSEDTNLESSADFSVLFAFLGQHIADDLVDSRRYSCPNEYVNIEFSDQGDLRTNSTVLPLYRSRATTDSGFSPLTPRSLTNEQTSWLDASAIYGSSNAMTSSLRSHVGGRLAENVDRAGFPAFNDRELPLYNPTIDKKQPPQRRRAEELLMFGNSRGNENPFLMTLGIIWFRWHNNMADWIASQHPEWGDEKVFIRARQYVIGVYQKIAFYDWLPEIIKGEVPVYSGYNEFLESSISSEFAIAAMRAGHSLVPSGVVLRDPSNCSQISPLPPGFDVSSGEPALRLCESYWGMQNSLLRHGIDSIALGMTSQAAEPLDHFVVEDLLDFSYGPLKRTRTNLEAVTIQRGRDAGLPTYNEARRQYDLEPLQNFSQLNSKLSSRDLRILTRMYNDDVDKLDLYVGGMLEGSDGSLGRLFREIVLHQFIRSRDSDRFWFENSDNSWFDDDEIAFIRNTSMRDVIIAVTAINDSLLQRNVFSVQEIVCPLIKVKANNFTKPCSPNQNMDFFAHQWTSYIGVILLLLCFAPVSAFVMLQIARRNQRKNKDENLKKSSFRRRKSEVWEADSFTRAEEVEGKEKFRRVMIGIQEAVIHITSEGGLNLRKIFLHKMEKIYIFLSRDKLKNFLVIRVPKEYDVVLRFETTDDRHKLLKAFNSYQHKEHLEIEMFEIEESSLRQEAVTKAKRQIILERFFLQVFSKVLQLNKDEIKSFKIKKHRQMKEVINCELNQAELAESLGMKYNSNFVNLMFKFADKDNSGYLSFKEFTDLIILLMSGSPEDKIRLLFNMYDASNSGNISKQEGIGMIRSLVETAGASVDDREIETAVESIFNEVGADHEITLEGFTQAMLKDHRSVFAGAQLTLPGLTKKLKAKIALFGQRGSYEKETTKNSGSSTFGVRKRLNVHNQEEKRNSVFSEAFREKEEILAWKRKWKSMKRFVENYRRHIICMLVFYGVTFAVVLERALFYAFGSEHSGIRRVSEWGIIISRSTAAGMSFHFSFILLTMCRNLITYFRGTILNTIIPFDSAIAFHKQVAYVAGVEAVLHAFGHLANFYHFAVHPLPVLSCLFSKILIDDGSDLPMSFLWWIFGTVPGFTGVLLLLTLSLIYVFAMQYSRQYCFRVFWIIHRLFSLLFALLLLHGSMGLIQEPVFHFYLFVPLIIFVIDNFITFKRSKIEIDVQRVELLPSDVLNLVFTKPSSFSYHSGQWVRIASPSLAASEYHPFTLTSAPHEPYLSLHIRSAGPWTRNLRKLYEESLENDSKLPNVGESCDLDIWLIHFYLQLYLDGPFGEGHQDWYKYKVSILVGAGIGVTPFASILKDIVRRKNTQRDSDILCEKVYFVWVTRTQKHFEWLTGIIRDLESSSTDEESLVSTHIYITQFFNKFDLRTTLLYICEQYFQKCSNRSMFTGLKATTHFGRPQFEPFFDSIQQIYSSVRTIGVFSCGPFGMTREVELACHNLNKLNKVQFNHFYENF